MDFDNIADNEDQMYKDILEDEEKSKKNGFKNGPKKSNNNYDDEGSDDY